jgi:hypothetical protein
MAQPYSILQTRLYSFLNVIYQSNSSPVTIQKPNF